LNPLYQEFCVLPKLKHFSRLERTRANLILERNNAIAQLKELDPTYAPPVGFHFKNAKLEDKVFLPAEVSAKLPSSFKSILKR
jgi:hypothetical protein